ncbi:MAG: Crp/Fnr family transcriptional regulator [Rhodobacteraceae bacterium]|nr:Crp/Fnr family transcriptional regulator [Paracoccaceae bacterium]
MLKSQNAFTQKLSTYAVLSESDLTNLAMFNRRSRRFQRGHEMIHEGQRTGSAFLLTDGWACSYKMLPEGDRQIVDFQVPGDFLGLRSILLQTSDHGVEALTQIEAFEVLTTDILDAFTRVPRMAAAVLWASARDEAMVAEHLVNIGRRTAEQRVAHMLLELGTRLKLVGIGDMSGYPCPLTQYHLADALGLSAIHVNRVLRHLREEGLVTFHKGQVIFEDRDRLKDVASFDSAYLAQDRPPLR